MRLVFILWWFYRLYLSYAGGEPTGRHSATGVHTVEASYTPLSKALRYRVRAAALRPRKVAY